jgi:quercetin dioxygenase-like cupin family protein
MSLPPVQASQPDRIPADAALRAHARNSQIEGKTVSTKGLTNATTSGRIAGRQVPGRWLPAILLASSLVVLAGALHPLPASASPAPQAKKWADQMPDGEGKTIIVAKCQLCHTLERVVTSHRTKDDWQAVISLMVEQGADLTDDQTKTVVDYLATNYPPKGAATPVAATAGSVPTSTAAGSAPAPAPSAIIDPDQTQFTAAPDTLGFPSGVTMAVVSGDPTKPGLFSILLKLPADQQIPPHWQASDVDMVVLRGTYELGNGDMYDASKLQAINPGQLIHIPAQTHQFGHAKTATVVLLYAVGPLSITWNK